MTRTIHPSVAITSITMGLTRQLQTFEPRTLDESLSYALALLLPEIDRVRRTPPNGSEKNFPGLKMYPAPVEMEVTQHVAAGLRMMLKSTDWDDYGLETLRLMNNLRKEIRRVLA